MRIKVGNKKGQNSNPITGIMDSQSVRCGNNRSLNGFDGNKKSKRHKVNVIVSNS